MSAAPLNITILGGGPSGLYLAMLLKRRQPALQVTVYEQNRADDTFGFGVVLADAGLNKLEDADAESAAAMRRAMHFADAQTIRLNEQSLDVRRPGAGGGAITRIELLKLLQERCLAAGVDLQFSTRVEGADPINPAVASALANADLVVGADGVSSALRTTMADEFGTSQRALKNRFAWYGTRKLFDNPALVFRQQGGGHFVAHYYRYSNTMSTFVAECDERTWFHCGLDRMTDAQRLSLTEQIFAPELGGEALVASNSTWRQFQVLRNRRWSHGKFVLVGDALASAHFSIGSGTRIAMEDAAALASAILQHSGSVPAITSAYEQSRRPGKELLIEASERSFNWYEEMAEKMAVGNVYEFVRDFMTRTGRITPQRLAQEYPDLVAMLDRQKAQVVS